MFEKFGEMDYQELDTLAHNLWNEGDKESLQTLCKENGLEYSDIEDAAADGVTMFITPTMAALGRLKVEREESKMPEHAKVVIFGMAETMAADPSHSTMFTMKGKRLETVWKTMEDMARKNRSGGSGCVCGTDRDLSKMIVENYKEAKK